MQVISFSGGKQTVAKQVLNQTGKKAGQLFHSTPVTPPPIHQPAKSAVKALNKDVFQKSQKP